MQHDERRRLLVVLETSMVIETDVDVTVMNLVEEEQ